MSWSPGTGLKVWLDFRVGQVHIFGIIFTEKTLCLDLGGFWFFCFFLFVCFLVWGFRVFCFVLFNSSLKATQALGRKELVLGFWREFSWAGRCFRDGTIHYSLSLYVHKMLALQMKIFKNTIQAFISGSKRTVIPLLNSLSMCPQQVPQNEIMMSQFML